MKITIAIAFFFLSGFISFGQLLSEQSTVSILTCDDGQELYSLFGHSAIRIHDPVKGFDKVYNYGVFEYGESEFDFSMKFARGRLRYMLQEETIEQFMVSYQYEKRGVREQVLNLSQTQIQNLYNLLVDNLQPENKYYKYDFFFDNCATRIRDILDKATGDQIEWFKHKDADKFSYRNIIDRNLEIQPWSDFGIDLALGSRIDVKTDNQNLMFLPAYKEKILAGTELNGKPIVKQNNVLLSYPPLEPQVTFWKTPGFMFWTLFVLIIVATYFRLDKLLKTFDSVYFSLIGLMGVVVLLLWFATDHIATKPNWNLVWANPIHFVVVFALLRKRLQPKLHKFYKVMMFFYFGFFLFWFFLPQELHHATRPLVLILGVRYYFWFQATLKKEKKSLLR